MTLPEFPNRPLGESPIMMRGGGLSAEVLKSANDFRLLITEREDVAPKLRRDGMRLDEARWMDECIQSNYVTFFINVFYVRLINHFLNIISKTNINIQTFSTHASRCYMVLIENS